MGELRYNNNSKLNKLNIIGYCTNCLEKAQFRATYAKKNEVLYTALTCTRCLSTTRYYKKGISQGHFYGMSLTKNLSLEAKIKRCFLRLYRFFILGTWNRKRFDFRLLRGK